MWGPSGGGGGGGGYHHHHHHHQQSSSFSSSTSAAFSYTQDPLPELRALLRSYYASHQPSDQDPRLLNVDIPPPLLPCACAACAQARALGVLAPDRSNQVLWVMQGAPGSGKSTLARALAAEHAGRGHRVVICSTDTFSLTPDGRYRWSAGRLAQNHEANLQRAVAFLDEGRSVVVDNTNIQAWQPRAYVRHAVKLGVQVRFVRATGDYPNVHNVPRERVEAMKRDMEVLTLDSVLNSVNPQERRALMQEEDVVGGASRAALLSGQFVGFGMTSSASSSSSSTVEGWGRSRGEDDSGIDRAMQRLGFGR